MKKKICWNYLHFKSIESESSDRIESQASYFLLLEFINFSSGRRVGDRESGRHVRKTSRDGESEKTLGMKSWNG